jgi:hypothetical protein
MAKQRDCSVRYVERIQSGDGRVLQDTNVQSLM